MILFMWSLYLDASPAALFLLGIMVAKLVVEFFGLWPVAEHGFYHSCTSLNYSLHW